MHCPKCGNEVQKSFKFCPHCGEEVPKIETGKSGVSIGDVGLIRGETIHIGAGEGAKAPVGDYCPICGVWAKTEASFRCRECGRANLHVEHRDQELGVCADCARELRPESPPAPIETQEESARVRIEGDELILTLTPGVELSFVRVPAGVFTMGSDESKDPDAFDNESPQHKVHLDEYWIGMYPVTNRQYQACVESIGREAPVHWDNGEIPLNKGDHPVMNVSWYDARAFCKEVSQLSGEHIRLPSEAEWEKAARSTDGRIYPWGDQEPDAGLCNFNSNINDTTQAGRYSPEGDSPYGCADMAGNVWEWTSSLYKDYPYRAGDGREDPVTEGERVLRGSSFWLEWDVRATRRFDGGLDWYHDSVGFRCARSP